MEQVTVNGADYIRAYKYEELSKEAQEVARTWAREHLLDWGDLLHFVREEFALVLHEEGIEWDEIVLGLDHCQGDGVSFDSHPFDLTPLIKAQGWESLLVEGFEPAGRFYRNSHRYAHPYTMDFEWWEYPAEMTQFEEDSLAHLNRLILNYARELCADFKPVGYEMIDAHQSDTRVEELLAMESDTLRFLADGTTLRWYL